MSAPRPIIVAEFNELCPWLIDRWMGEGRLPNFQCLHDTANVFTTIADVTDPANLEPWIQWYSLHTGLAFDQHGVFHLTEGTRAEHDDIWHAAHRAGKTVASMASMNNRAFAFPGSFYVADPWCEAGNAFPAELNLYGRFVAGNVQEYSNPDQKGGLGEALRFVRFLAGHGLSAGTAAAIVRQIASERLIERGLSWRRASLLDRLQFDVFRHYHRRRRPDFATFFINSTAHFQHSYWRQFQPEAFSVKPSPEEVALYRDAILFGYQTMDRLLGRFIALAQETEARLILATALSQQPYLAAEAQGGKHFYRLRDVEALFRAHALPFANIDPTMTHQYLVTFAAAAELAKARETLGAFRTGSGESLFDFNARTEGGLYFSCGLSRPVADSEPIVLPDGTSMPFSTLLYRIDATKSGRHHPDGALWIGDGRHARHETPVSILDVFPTLLDLMGIEPSGNNGRRGTSLVPHLGGGRGH